VFRDVGLWNRLEILRTDRPTLSHHQKLRFGLFDRGQPDQTFHHEIEGGYLWSPKSNANGARNSFYETMREVSPGDLILSFVDTRRYRHRLFLLL